MLTLVDLPAGVGQQKPFPNPQGNVFKSDDGLIFSQAQNRIFPEIGVFLDIQPVILIAFFLIDDFYANLRKFNFLVRERF